MLKEDRSTKVLIGLIIGVYAIVVSLFVVLYFKVSRLEKIDSFAIKTEEVQELEKSITPEYVHKVLEEVEPPKIVEKPKTKSVFEKSIEYCEYYYAEEIAKCVWECSLKYDIPVYVIYAIIMTESEMKVKAHSSASCRGLMQISNAVLEEYNWLGHNYTVDDLWKIDVNIEIGCWYFSKMRKAVMKNNPNDSKYSYAYCAYNVGLSNWKKYKSDYVRGYNPVHKNSYGAINRFNRYLDDAWSHFN